MPDFWTIRIEAVDQPPFQPTPVDINKACRTRSPSARTCSRRRRRSRSTTSTSASCATRSRLDVTAGLDYGLSGLGGTQLQRGVGPFGPGTGDVIGQTRRSVSSVLGDIFTNDFPAWTASVTVSYPLGTSQAEAALARVRLQNTQDLAQLRNQELQVSTQVREAGRQVQTNQKRVETTRASRALAERRLEAEQREVRGGHVHDVHRVPGPARPGPGAQQRAARDSRLQPVDRGPGDGAGSAARGRRGRNGSRSRPGRDGAVVQPDGQDALPDGERRCRRRQAADTVRAALGAGARSGGASVMSLTGSWIGVASGGVRIRCSRSGLLSANRYTVSFTPPLSARACLRNRPPGRARATDCATGLRHPPRTANPHETPLIRT